MKLCRLHLALLVPLVLSTLPAHAQGEQPEPAAAQAEKKAADQETDEFLNLGVDNDYQKRERYNIVDQITSFIPPLYQPAFVGHGFVLPPGAMRVRLGFFSVDLDGADFFKDGGRDPVHENHKVDRKRVDLGLFYGLDHNMTLFVNIPYWSSRSRGSVHPAGVKTLDLFAEGNTLALGDVSVILKKKWVDQGNFYFNLATVTGIKLPTGSNDAKFDQPLVLKRPDGSLVTAFNGGPFPRFTDDGRLPAVLQPGTGAFGYIFGVMGTRQFLRPLSALHAGVIYRFLGSADGVKPGDELRFFASYVKPIFKQQVSLDFTVNGMNKGHDSYRGTFTHPVPNPDGTLKGFATTPRPPFQSGTVVFFSPSLIWSPDPQIRMTATYSTRLNKPALGPWPGNVVQLGFSYTFPVVKKGEL